MAVSGHCESDLCRGKKPLQSVRREDGCPCGCPACDAIAVRSGVRPPSPPRAPRVAGSWENWDAEEVRRELEPWP
jgi:hypothetical protein